jgi:allophanate hydrolase subunit 1
MFDPARQASAVLRAGDAVRFIALPHDEWDAHAGGPWA